VLHGDPEIDNLVFTADGPLFFDLDDIRRGWFAADVAFALRAWGGPATAADVRSGIPAEFVRGYRGVRELSDLELSWMPLMIRAAELETLADLLPLIADTPNPEWPGWATALYARVARRADALAGALATG